MNDLSEQIKLKKAEMEPISTKIAINLLPEIYSCVCDYVA